MLVISTKFYPYFEYLACCTIINYFIHAHIICELCRCLLLWIILFSSSCNMTSNEKQCTSYHLTAE